MTQETIEAEARQKLIEELESKVNQLKKEWHNQGSFKYDELYDEMLNVLAEYK